MKLNFQELDNYINQKAGSKEFFFGAWAPEALALETGEIPEDIQLEKGDNWFMCRNGANLCNGIVIRSDNRENMPAAILFRGYLSEAGIHSYSPPEKVIDYWNKELVARHNGIFVSVIVNQTGEKISIVTDIFGVSPIYYRMVDDVLLFSSAPGLLSQADDKPDFMSWMTRLEIGYIPSNKSLIKGVEIAPPASVTAFSRDGVKIEKWYDYSNFAKGEQEIDSDALEQYEQGLTVAMDRCKAIQNGRTVLPFSSGYDSRRLFVQLRKHNIHFETCTVQADDSEGRDVDAVWASNMAEDNGVECVVFPMPEENSWYYNHMQRLFSLDAHTHSHTWSVPVFDHYNHQMVTFYDGIGGDVLGNSGWDYEGIHDNPNDKFGVIQASLFKNNYAKYIKRGIFPPFKIALSALSDEYHKQPAGANQSEITFCLWHTRRSTSLWAQQQSRPGQLVVCPFFDLDHVETMFQFSPQQKLSMIAQGVVLRKYWPEIAAYPGSRDIPENSPNIGNKSENNRLNALNQMIKTYFQTASGDHLLRKIVPFPYRVLLYLSQYSHNLSRRIFWWASQIIELVTWWHSRPSIYSLTKKEK